MDTQRIENAKGVAKTATSLVRELTLEQIDAARAQGFLRAEQDPATGDVSWIVARGFRITRDGRIAALK